MRTKYSNSVPYTSPDGLPSNPYPEGYDADTWEEPEYDPEYEDQQERDEQDN